ncbi:probable serine/threonine-protein kinase DDB_G0278509, partial [Pseudomyrmex gracilis]|uniref:probable serine/threonine-protein kinase DDB_G0278509 n=1 Tax=Pseudomyrmex gracilis TaxID=219809 RepID=UPI000994CAC9
MTFSELDATLRTDESFALHSQEEYHKNFTPLEKIDNYSNSSNKISDNVFIPELNNNLRDQDNINQNIDDNINQTIDHNINQNIGDNNSQILHVNEIPIVLEAEDNVISITENNIPIATETLNSILRYVLEIKLMCKRIDERLHVLENNGNNINIGRNIDMLPQLPMDCFEDINNFEIISAYAIKTIYPSITEAQFEEILKAWFRQANFRLNREKVRNNARNDN